MPEISQQLERSSSSLRITPSALDCEFRLHNLCRAEKHYSKSIRLEFYGHVFEMLSLLLRSIMLM